MIYLGGAAPKQVIPLLIRVLESAGLVRTDLLPLYHSIGAIEVLGQIGDEARDALPVLLKLLDSSDDLVRAAAVQALVKVGPSSTQVMNAIASRFDDPDEKIRSRDVYEVGRYGELARPLWPKFVELLDSQSKEVRIWAAQALVKSGYDEARGFDVLIGDVAAGATADRELAAVALAALGSQAQSIIPKLRAYANDPDEAVAKGVRDAIRRIEQDERIFTHAEEAARNAAARKASTEAMTRLRAAMEQPAAQSTEVAGQGATPERIAEIVRPLLPSIVSVIRTNPKTGKPDPNPNWQAGIVVDERGYILTTLTSDFGRVNQIKVRRSQNTIPH